MSHPLYDVNKVAEDVLSSLNRLAQEIHSSEAEEGDYLSQETPQAAYAALEKFKSILQESGESVARSQGRVFDLCQTVESKLRNPSIQTMVGAMAVELSGILKVVMTILRPKDTKKVEGTSLEKLGK